MNKKCFERTVITGIFYNVFESFSQHSCLLSPGRIIMYWNDTIYLEIYFKYFYQKHSGLLKQFLCKQLYRAINEKHSKRDTQKYSKQ